MTEACRWWPGRGEKEASHKGRKLVGHIPCLDCADGFVVPSSLLLFPFSLPCSIPTASTVLRRPRGPLPLLFVLAGIVFLRQPRVPGPWITPRLTKEAPSPSPQPSYIEPEAPSLPTLLTLANPTPSTLLPSARQHSSDTRLGGTGTLFCSLCSSIQNRVAGGAWGQSTICWVNACTTLH